MEAYSQNRSKLPCTNKCPGPKDRLLYHLAPLFFAGKPAVALNRAVNPRGGTFEQPGEDWLVKLAPDCVTRFFRWGAAPGRVLVLYYRPGRLREILSGYDNRSLLAGFGYRPECDLEADLNHLQTRFTGPFPHEIGIFLGIPAHDVAGFIVNRGKNYLLNGYWKVYHHPGEARRVFNEFNRAKRKLARFILEGD